MGWKDNFATEISVSAVPAGILARLKEHASQHLSVYLVLYEDVYETVFGDGRFLYPEAAFWDEDAARSFLRLRETAESKRPAGQLGYKYSLKVIQFRESQGTLAATLNIEDYEHYSVEHIVRLLACTPDDAD